MPEGPAPATPLARALRWLARRDRSEREVRARLAEWGTPATDAEDVIQHLHERGYLNDAALAERLCDWHDRHDPLGPLRLRRRLEQRGIDAADAAAALAGRDDPERQRALAEGLAARREGALASLPALARWRRLHDYLARRGFDAAIVRELCEPHLAAAREAEDAEALD